MGSTLFVAPVRAATISGLVGFAVALTVGRLLGWPLNTEHMMSAGAFAVAAPLARYMLIGVSDRQSGWALPAVRDSTLALALTAVVVTGVGFGLDVDVARRLLLVQAAVALLTESLLTLRAHAASRDDKVLRLAVVCDDMEFDELARGVAEHRAAPPGPGASRMDVAIRLVGLLDDQRVVDLTDDAQARRRRHGVASAPVADLKSVCDEYQVSLVLVGQGWLRDPQFLAIAESAQDAGVRMASLPGFFEQHFMRVPVHCLDPRWFFDLTHERRASYRRFQQLVGLLAAALAGMVLLVLGPLIAAAIVLESGRPVFYRQTRLGLHGRTFELLKFRTMTTDAEAHGPRFTRTGDPRITRVGKLLRRSRLDELPQLFNILRRDMTFIGPRPERPEFAGGFAGSMPYYRRRLGVRPGLTGWAQVNEDYAASEEETLRKLERDLFYLKYQSLSLDAIILARTARSVLHLRGR